jgi:serine/threonine-protein kinase
MAEVYRARVLSGAREGWTVALKRLLPELVKNAEYVQLFTHEAELSSYLNHPNVVRTLEVGSLQGISYIVMDYVDGRDLGQILRRCKERNVQLPIDFAVFLVKTLLDALSYAHNATNPQGEPLGIVHCDVSPSNLFISRTGEIKLGDFGVARARFRPQKAGEVTGKPYYVSPEVLDGKVSIAADLWAANVVLYEALTLQRPFLGTTPEQVLGAVGKRQYLAPRSIRMDLPPALQAIIERGFAKKSQDRFKSAAEFAELLESHYDERIGTPLGIAAVVRGLFGAS